MLHIDQLSAPAAPREGTSTPAPEAAPATGEGESAPATSANPAPREGAGEAAAAAAPAFEEILLCKCGEVVLKGLNRSSFESAMVRCLRHRLAAAGEYTVTRGQSVFTVRGARGADMRQAQRLAATVFGFNQISLAIACDKTVPAIVRAATERLLPPLLASPDPPRSFKCEAKRADKTFPHRSPELCALVGGEILRAYPRLRVDVHHPDIILRIEVRDRAYLHAGGVPGAGGVPSAGGGRSLLLLSGGIDSPVAGYRMARRGSTVEALHFTSFPYTSERAKEKVFDLARALSVYTGGVRLHTLSLTELQEEIVRRCDEPFFTLVLRRSMMRLACRLAAARDCGAIITGESLGQVASQTQAALTVTDAAADRPVFRPLIGMDKEEIIRTARAIGSFELSIEPFEDCCTVFTPRHPKTRPRLSEVEAQEAKLDLPALEDAALATLESSFLTVYPRERHNRA